MHPSRCRTSIRFSGLPADAHSTKLLIIVCLLVRVLAQLRFPGGVGIVFDFPRLCHPVPDTNAIVDAGFKYGGLDYATQLFSYLGGQSTAARQGEIDSGILGYGAAV